MFLVLSVCLSTAAGVSHVTIAHDVLDLTVQPQHSLYWARPSSPIYTAPHYLRVRPRSLPASDFWWPTLEPFQTCSLEDLIVYLNAASALQISLVLVQYKFDWGSPDNSNYISVFLNIQIYILPALASILLKKTSMFPNRL